MSLTSTRLRPRSLTSSRAPDASPREDKLKIDSIKQLPNGMRVVSYGVRFKRGSVHGGIKGIATVYDKDNKAIATVPIDKAGNIPNEAAVARFLDIDQGDREGRERSPIIDLFVEADVIAKAKPATQEQRLLQFLWYLHPNEMDMANVDVPGSTWAPTKASLEKGTKVAIIATEAERAAVVTTLEKNFTARERRLMQGLVIEVDSARSGWAGYFQHAQGPIQYDKIVVGREYLLRTSPAARVPPPDTAGPNKGNPVYDDVLTHEVIHFLRLRDPQRTGFSRRPTINLDATGGKDRDLEEAATDSETTNRSRISPVVRKAGYYQRLKESQYPAGVTNSVEAAVYDKEVMAGIVDKDGKPLDPKRLASAIDYVRNNPPTGEPFSDPVVKSFKGKRGKNAVIGTEKAFPNLALAKLKMHGRAEAIDTFWEYRTRAGNGKQVVVTTQVYNPEAVGAGEAPAQLRDVVSAGLAGPRTRGLSEWRDGVLHPVAPMDTVKE